MMVALLAVEKHKVEDTPYEYLSRGGPYMIFAVHSVDWPRAWSGEHQC